jgi:hypothetical protein
MKFAVTALAARRRRAAITLAKILPAITTTADPAATFANRGPFAATALVAMTLLVVKILASAARQGKVAATVHVSRLDTPAATATLYPQPAN